jgi:ubiquinone/menaquinone biosynthesis C-methylase UbiE
LESHFDAQNGDWPTFIDLACGIGQFTRRFRRAGARHVVGVDISAEMITVARQTEAAEPLGILHRVGAAAALPVIGSFDLATGVFLLNYAATASELEAMLRGVASNLSPGRTARCADPSTPASGSMGRI